MFTFHTRAGRIAYAIVFPILFAAFSFLGWLWNDTFALVFGIVMIGVVGFVLAFSYAPPEGFYLDWEE